MNISKKVGSKGIGFWSILFMVFLVMKLTDNIDWSWWWVTAPLWLPVIILLSLLGIAAAGLFLIELCKGN